MLAPLRSTLLTVMFALALVSPAHAQVTYAGQRPASALVQTLVAKADAWWLDPGRGAWDIEDYLVRDFSSGDLRKLSGTCPQGVQAWEAPNLAGDDGSASGRGDGATCEVWIADAIDISIHNAFLWQNAAHGCMIVLHEVGHARGMPHSPTGVMSSGLESPPTPLAWYTGYCLSWGKIWGRRVMRAQGMNRRALDKYTKTGPQR